MDHPCPLISHVATTFMCCVVHLLRIPKCIGQCSDQWCALMRGLAWPGHATVDIPHPVLPNLTTPRLSSLPVATAVASLVMGALWWALVHSSSSTQYHQASTHRLSYQGVQFTSAVQPCHLSWHIWLTRTPPMLAPLPIPPIMANASNQGGGGAG